MEQLNAALLDVFDLMQRVLLDTTFIVVGDAARCMKEKRGLDCEVIECVVEKRHVTKEVMSTFREWVKGEVTGDGFSYEYGGVPVKCKFIKNEYPYFTFADQRLYGPEIYKIPNQWDEYWEHRKEII